MVRHLVAAVAASFVIVSAAQADTTTPNASPAVGWHYGNGGNDYTPANTLVLDTTDGGQLYGRWHPNSDQAPASSAGGVYSFALGTPSISYDYGFTAPTGQTTASWATDAFVRITNLGTGGTFGYNPFVVTDNYTGDNSLQNSERLTFMFAAPAGFDPNVNQTYRMVLTAAGHTLTTFAQVGSGTPSVPEPASWAMLIVGFAGVGIALRRRSAVRTRVRFA